MPLSPKSDKNRRGNSELQEESGHGRGKREILCADHIV